MILRLFYIFPLRNNLIHSHSKPKNMKKYFTGILSVLLCLSICAQTTKGGKATQPKVTKEEKKEDSKSSKYGDRTKYQITYADGTTGKLYQAKADGKWWGSALYMDKGPFTKGEAVTWLYNYEQTKNAAKGAAVLAAGAVVLHQTTKSAPKTSINLNQNKGTSINLNKKQ